MGVTGLQDGALLGTTTIITIFTTTAGHNIHTVIIGLSQTTR
jgi:hypothetical protein